MASRRWSCGSTAPAARCSRRNASARRFSQAKAEQDPGRRVDGQRRGVGRLLGLDARRLHLCRALDDHRIDRRVRDPAELPGHPAEARHRRRRREDDAAFGRAGPASRAPRPKPRQLLQTGVEFDLRPLPRASSPRRATRPRSRSTRSRRAVSGTAARRTSSAWSTAFGGIDDAVAKAAQLANLGNERRVRYLEPPQELQASS